MSFLELPQYSYSARQPKMPGRHAVVARFIDGSGIKYEVCTNHRGKVWWVSASRGGFRRSNTLRTTSPAKGAEWRAAVEAGHVGIAGRE